MTDTLDTIETPSNLEIQYVETLTEEEKESLKEMQQEVFSSTVDEKEASEDFINEPYAHLLIKDENKIIGNLDLHHSLGTFKGEEVSIGGLSIGILEEYRKHGYGGKLISMAMEHLKNQNYDLAFLAAAPGTIPLYEKYGWQVLKVPYTWKNVHGEIKSDTDGMIFSLNNPGLVDSIQEGNTSLYVGRGYW